MKIGSELLRQLVNALTLILACLALALLAFALAGVQPPGLSLEGYIKTLTFAGFLLAAVFSAVARAFEFRTDDKKSISPWGRTILSGIVVSFVVSASSLAIGLRKDIQSAVDAQERSAELLKTISRSATRIERLALAVSFQISDGFSNEWDKKVLSLSGQTGISIGSHSKAASACAEGFPHFGSAEVERKFEALQRVSFEIAIVSRAEADDFEEHLGAWAKTDRGLTAEEAKRAVEGFLEYRGLSKSLTLTLEEFKRACAEADGYEELYISSGDNSFIDILTPPSDILTWRSDGSILSLEDLKDKVMFVWSNLLVDNAILGERGPTIDHVALAFPPAGVRCYGSEKGKGAEVKDIGPHDHVIRVDLSNPELDIDRNSQSVFATVPRSSIFC